jgi:hypothetical protein
VVFLFLHFAYTFDLSDYIFFLWLLVLFLGGLLGDRFDPVLGTLVVFVLFFEFPQIFLNLPFLLFELLVLALQFPLLLGEGVHWF